MAHILARTLDDLEPNLRTPSIIDLVSSLTINELRLLKSRLAAVDFRTDIIARLPVELQLCVADHVSSSDVFSYINVSRTWRQIWMQDKIMNQLVERWYPGLFLQDYEQENTGYDLRKAMFLRTLQRDFRLSRGQFRSVLTHGFRLEDDNYFKLDESLHSKKSNEAYREILVTSPSDRGLGGVLYFYRNGKLAWNPSTRPPPDNGVIILDDFRSKIRKMFKVQGTLMQALSISLRALGDKFVVGVDSRVAHVWNIDSNEYQTVALPSRIYTCKSTGDYVSFVTDDGGVFIWKSQGRLLEVDLAKPREIFAALPRPPHLTVQNVYSGHVEDRILTRAHVDVILHPFESGVFFVVTMNTASSPQVGAIAVHEYRDNHYSQTYTVDLPDHQSTTQSQQFLPVFSLIDCCPIDPHGSFRLTNLNRISASAVPLSIMVTFNVVKRSFAITSVLVPIKAEHARNRRDLSRGVRSHFWRQQATFSVSNLWDIGYRLPLITQSTTSTNPSTIPSQDRLKSVLGTATQALVEYGLDPVRGQHFTPQDLKSLSTILDPGIVNLGNDDGSWAFPATPNDYSIREARVEEFPQPGICRGICGDDDFLIFVGEDNYTVWSFDAYISREVDKPPV